MKCQRKSEIHVGCLRLCCVFGNTPELAPSVVSKLMYSLCTLCLTEKQMRLLDSFHIRCLRSIAGIPSTWGATLLGIERISNEQVRCQMNLLNLSDELRLQQMSLLGHILRRPPNHPARVVTFNRFLQPQMLGGPFMRGARRIKWNDVVLQLATTIVNDHYFQGAGVEKYIHPASRGVAAHTAGLFRSVRGAKGGFPPWGLPKLRIFTFPPVGAPQAREFSLFPPVGAPQAREFSLFPPVGAPQAREFSLFPPVGDPQAREFSLFPPVGAPQAREFSL